MFHPLSSIFSIFLIDYTINFIIISTVPPNTVKNNYCKVSFSFFFTVQFCAQWQLPQSLPQHPDTLFFIFTIK